MNNVYESPLSSRYASKEMLYNFSSDMKFSTWRRLWVSLAKAEMALGLPITQEQVDEMEAHITDIDYDVARQREKEVRHDVMAHVYTFGKVAPKAFARNSCDDEVFSLIPNRSAISLWESSSIQ